MLTTLMQVFSHIFMGFIFLSMVWIAVGLWRKFKRRTALLTQFVMEVFIAICLCVLFVVGDPMFGFSVYIWLLSVFYVSIVYGSLFLRLRKKSVGDKKR